MTYFIYTNLFKDKAL